jgi:hypothetical protein
MGFRVLSRKLPANHYAVRCGDMQVGCSDHAGIYKYVQGCGWQRIRKVAASRD